MLYPIAKHRIVAQVPEGRSADSQMYTGLRNAVGHVFLEEVITLGKTYVLAFQCQLNPDAVLFTSVLLEGLPDNTPLNTYVNVGQQEPRQDAIRAIVQFVARADWRPGHPQQYALAYRFPSTVRKMDYAVVRFAPYRNAFPQQFRNYKWETVEKEERELWINR